MDRIAIVTGASSGLGREISLQLSKQDYYIVAIGRNKIGLDDICKKIKNINKKCTTIKLDINKKDFINKLKIKIERMDGNVELIVNNAGLGIFDKIENINFEDWEKQISINLTSSFLLTQAFIKKMKKNKRGILVYINSVAGKQAYPYSSAYVASKFALRGFADSIREELRDYNIKVISIFPGAIDTPFWNNVDADFPRDEMMKASDVAVSIADTVKNKGVSVVEELLIRRNKGDF